jgi:hypothetical protein
MSTPTLTYVLGVLAALATTLFVLELLRRGILREKFAALWLVVSGVLVVLAVFPQVLTWAAGVVGIALPANLLFFLAAVLLLLVSVQLSYEVSRLEARTRRLAEELALLRDDVRLLEQQRRDED